MTESDRSDNDPQPVAASIRTQWPEALARTLLSDERPLLRAHAACVLEDADAMVKALSDAGLGETPERRVARKLIAVDPERSRAAARELLAQRALFSTALLLENLAPPHLDTRPPRALQPSTWIGPSTTWATMGGSPGVRTNSASRPTWKTGSARSGMSTTASRPRSFPAMERTVCPGDTTVAGSADRPVTRPAKGATMW